LPKIHVLSLLLLKSPLQGPDTFPSRRKEQDLDFFNEIIPENKFPFAEHFVPLTENTRMNEQQKERQ
jgi:hypothetical protein